MGITEGATTPLPVVAVRQEDKSHDALRQPGHKDICSYKVILYLHDWRK